MDTGTIKAMLEKADPSRNTSVHERQNALRMAEREMDKAGLSYASLGFSHEDAERIANQFSVISGAGVKEERASLGLFKEWSRPETGIQKHAPSAGPKLAVQNKPVRKVEQPYESYVDRCEREEWARVNARHNDWEQWRKDEDVKESKIKASADRALVFLVPLLLIVIGLMLYFTVIKPLAM